MQIIMLTYKKNKMYSDTIIYKYIYINLAKQLLF